jgi:hypothetical protein
MAMLWRSLAAGALAAVVFAWTAPARAGDTVKLGLDKSATPTVTLELKPGDDAEATLAHWHAHYYGGGFYHAGHYGYGHAYYHVGHYGYGFSPAYYYPRRYGYSSFYYGGFYPRYFYSPTVTYYSQTPVYYYSQPLYYSAPYCSPIGLSATLQTPGDQMPPPMTQVNPGLGTYPYDGGPANPVPMPKVDPAPTNVPPKAVVPGDERPVALPARSGKYSYLAYGEKPGQVEKDETPALVVRMEPLNKKAPR